MDDSSASRRQMPRTRGLDLGTDSARASFQFSCSSFEGCPRAPTRKRAPHAIATSHQRSRLATLVLLTILAVRPSPHLASDARPRSPLRVGPDASRCHILFERSRDSRRSNLTASPRARSPRRVPAPYLVHPCLPSDRRGLVAAGYARFVRGDRGARRERVFGPKRVSEHDASCPARAAVAVGATTRSRTARRSTCGAGARRTPASAREAHVPKECAPDTMVGAHAARAVAVLLDATAAPRRVVPATRAPPPRRRAAPFQAHLRTPFQPRTKTEKPVSGPRLRVPGGAPRSRRPWRYDASLLPGRGEPEAGARLVRRRAGRARVAEARTWPGGHADSQAGPATYYTPPSTSPSLRTPDARRRRRSAVALRDLQALFGGPKRVALDAPPPASWQVVTCYAQGSGARATPWARASERTARVLACESHYDNSCAEAHACAEVKVLSPEQAGGGGAPTRAPGKVAPGGRTRVRGDADCVGESGCVRCAHSGHCTAEPPLERSDE